MRRLANIGFGIAMLYLVYIVAVLVMAARTNASFEGQELGEFQFSQIAAGASVVSAQGSLAPDESLLGEKRVVILWATWCAPCHALLADLKEEVLAGRIKPEVITAVSVAEPEADVRAYLQKTPLPFRVALDPSGELAKRMKLAATPTVVFLDQTGVIESVSTGSFRVATKIIEFFKADAPR
jgi:thiol-disulfide isomerase/thioredoxin